VHRVLKLLFLVPLVVGAAPAWGQGNLLGDADGPFRVEWEATKGKRGPQVTGYVHNKADYPADRVRVQVEALDAAGNVVGTTTGYVNGLIAVGGYRRFQVSVPADATSYRVRVLTWDWVGRGAG